MIKVEQIIRLRRETNASLKACKAAIDNHKDILLKSMKKR